MIFAYNANVAFESSTAGVVEQADNLLNRLRGKRRRGIPQTRPIIFVAHSLGGIIVKRVRDLFDEGTICVFADPVTGAD
jgi:predicted alpha/beta hydrolase family esterase